MAAAAAPILPGPLCVHCKGGKVINGVPCADCEGVGRVVAGRRRWRRLRGRLLGVADAAAVPAGLTVRSLPGVLGAAAVSYGPALIAHGIWHQVPVLGVVLTVAGVFGVLADRRL